MSKVGGLWFAVRRLSLGQEGRGVVVAIECSETEVHAVQTSEAPTLYVYSLEYPSIRAAWGHRAPRVGDEVLYTPGHCVLLLRPVAELAQELDQLIASILEPSEVP